ncbi:MAG: sugar kinase, partial [Rhodothermales bacterium]|nr:sugar kinase [Rhodothermales bacterium]
MPQKVVTFGEIMLRLSTPAFDRFVQASQFDLTFGGGEANVAASLAQFGVDAFFVSRLPTNPMGDAALSHLRRFGVRTDYIARGGDRLGIYFLETGASQRPSKVVYDRSHSAVTTFEPSDTDWNVVFQDASWFHWTGITPALGEAPRRALADALAAARSNGATISCDLNYRAKLWSVKQAQAAMRPLMEFVDVCIANEEDAEKCLGMRAADSDVDEATIDEAGYAQLTQNLRSEFGFDAVAITLRESHSASRNEWSAMLLGGAGKAAPVTEAFRSRKYDIQIVDRVGAGDSFAAGLIYGFLKRDT